jgi:hypothetical protein
MVLITCQLVDQQTSTTHSPLEVLMAVDLDHFNSCYVDKSNEKFSKHLYDFISKTLRNAEDLIETRLKSRKKANQTLGCISY